MSVPSRVYVRWGASRDRGSDRTEATVRVWNVAEKHAVFEQTIPRRGIGGVAFSQNRKRERRQMLEAKLALVKDGRVVFEYPPLQKRDYVIGRVDEKPVDIDLTDKEPDDRIYSSRQHACLRYKDGRFTIEDLGSTNGTYIDGIRVEKGEEKSRELKGKEKIQIGSVVLQLRYRFGRE